MFELNKLTVEEEIDEKEKITLRKNMSIYRKKAYENINNGQCCLCKNRVEGYCNSHSIPRFILNTISSEGKVYIPNRIIKLPFLNSDDGVNRVGTFHLICAECDNSMFKEYETPEMYDNNISEKMLKEITLKNTLLSLYKTRLEKELYGLFVKDAYDFKDMFEKQCSVKECDRNAIQNYLNVIKNSLNKNDSIFRVIWDETLEYETNIAFQGSLSLITDFDGNLINDVYNYSKKDGLHELKICVFPFNNKTRIIIFYDKSDKRYKDFEKKFLQMNLEEKLELINYLIILYSEEVYYSKNIPEYIFENRNLIEISQMEISCFSDLKKEEIIIKLKELYNLNNRIKIPNFLSEQLEVPNEGK